MLFRGVAGDPEEITEETLTLNFTNKLSLQRVAIPDVRVQRTCPWNFLQPRHSVKKPSKEGSTADFHAFIAADTPLTYRVVLGT